MSNIQSPIQVTADSAENLRSDLSFRYELTADNFVIQDKTAYDAVTVQFGEVVNEHEIQKAFYGKEIRKFKSLSTLKRYHQQKSESVEKKHNRQGNIIAGLGLCFTVASAIVLKNVLDNRGFDLNDGQMILGAVGVLTPIMTAIGIASHRINKVGPRKAAEFEKNAHAIDEKIKPLLPILDEYRDNLHIMDILNGMLKNYEIQNPGQDYPKRAVPSLKPEMV